ncbi:hypothetical protein PV08_00695 [Exophiala spinifera]|uniref:DUF7707 domain-containing protein n=1 Tax=Exophiala spinifera TaxID=91928 RepID=A0A0D2BNL3_9EURO|nr:uncharacterized protein PV08_00695 [Exophiala spinifera]KIW20120.1 hypothetical protein PV08_00695 [Exophiala spinifera]
MQFLVLATTVAAFTQLAITQTIDPNSVPLSTRQTWCNSQRAQCPLICVDQTNSAGTNSNDCDPTDLAYSCICANGLSPNASEYSLTMPYYICTQYNTDCQANCGNDNTCAAACVQNHPCGATDPTRVNTSTISTMSATSTTNGAAASTASDGGVVYTGFGGASAAATTAGGDSGSSAATRVIVNMGQLYGLGVLVAGIFAGFALML